MRTAPNNHIWNTWNNGLFVGDDGAPHGRVTVERGWQLHKSASATIGTYDKGPIRYFQNSDNSQEETEIPNIKTIEIDRTIDTDAATCVITMFDQKMLNNGQAPPAGTAGESVGQPGFFWPTRGDTAAAQDRWGWETNIWNNVLQPNALIRVYQGYGGRSKTIENALQDGNIILAGIFLVDSVSQDAETGLLTINCRDMAKLVIEQMVYPPLIPTGESQSVHYPINYYRWKYVNHPVIPYGNTVYNTGFTAIEGKLDTGNASSVEGGHNSLLAIDGDDVDTYWLSGGTINPNGTEFIEYHTNGAQIEAVNIQPFGGNYRCHVYIDGVLRATQGLGWERAATIDLGYTDTNPAPASATIRVTFDHLMKQGPSPLSYRAGVRNLQIGTFSNRVTGGGRTVTGIQRTHNQDSTRNGTKAYWLCGSDGGVFSFGGAKFYGSEGKATLNGDIIGMASHSGTGKGYRLGAKDGGVFCFGDVYYHGSLPGLGITVTNVCGIENGNLGHTGYYLIRDTGEIYAFGTATHYGNHSGSAVTGMAVKQTPPYGYWTVDITGAVQAHGGVSNHGSVSNITGFATAIEWDGDAGYWIVDTNGSVYSFGTATYHGGVNNLSLGGVITDMTRTGTGNGYWLVGDDGGVFAKGDALFSGSLPEQFNSIGDGNYCVDPETEILTKRGWLSYDEIQVGRDESLAIDPETGQASWEEIYDLYIGYRTGDMILMDGKGHSSLTTPDHRWLTEYRGKKRWITSENMTDLDSVPVAAPITLPTVSKFTDEFVELVGWMWTEGYFGRPYRPDGGTTQISQSEKVNAPNVKRIQHCLRTLYGESGTLRGKNAAKWRDEYVMSNGVRLFRLGREVSSDLWEQCRDKILSLDFLHSLTQRQLDVLIETSLAADGHVKATASTLEQRSREAAEAFQIACILSGRAATLTYRKQANMWEVSVKKRTTCNPIRSGRAVDSFKVETVPYEGIVWCPTMKYHNWLARRKGKVYFTGNSDYTDIIKDLLLWSGWWFRNPADPLGASPQVFGNLEDTGIFSPDNLTEDFFDKKPVIDVINSIKEIVGYVTWVDEIGAFHFELPNVWDVGNFLETGAPTTRMAVLDEEESIFGYQADFNDTDARSTIIIATEDPALNLSDTKSVTITSQWAGPVLRGIIRPALWVNGKFLTTAVQRTMANMIDLQLWMQSRQGSITIPCNPIIQINDQVQIYERSTSDTFIHYVRGYRTTMDLESGDFTQTLQLHWMGDGTSWALNYTPVDDGGFEDTGSDDPDVAPSFTAFAPPDGSISTAYTYQFGASGTPTPSFVIVSGSLPAGLSLSTNGILSGTPSTEGSFTFGVQAVNGVSPADSVEVTIDIAAGSSGLAPALQNQTPPNGTVGVSYSYTFTATGTPTPSYSLSSGSLPTGLSLNTSTGNLHGTPTAAGTYNFTISADNSQGSDDNAVTVVIAASGGGGGGGSSPPPSGGYFSLTAVGASLPGGMSAAGADAAAAAAVHSSTWEPRPDNNTANHTILSQPPTIDGDAADFDATWNSTYLPRVSGNFSGTTDEIIQWAAYKWGWSDEYVRAQMIQESDWHQNSLGDYEPASNGHRVFDRSDDPSPTSFGLPQCRWYYHPPIVALGGVTTGSSDSGSSYPKSRQSTAWVMDFFLCYLRGVYDGHSTYLNGGGMAGSGDAWGAIGSWFSGGWHDSDANSYISQVQGHLSNKAWLNSGF